MTKRIVLLQGLANTPEQLGKLLHQVENRSETNGLLAQMIERDRETLFFLQTALSPIPPDEHNPLPAVTSPDKPDSHTFYSLRAKILRQLMDLEPEMWRNVGSHPSWGENSVLMIVQKLFEHDKFKLNNLQDNLVPLPKNNKHGKYYEKTE